MSGYLPDWHPWESYNNFFVGNKRTNGCREIIIFITNPTEFHIDTLKKVEGKSKNFFIEKPLTSVRKIDDVIKFVPESGALYYVACPLRYIAEKTRRGGYGEGTP